MKKITKCVIPAAGMGTRFLPATKALPKEMFPIIDKPVMQMLVEEAISAGCTDIIIITGRNKRAIEDHFDSNSELETSLENSNKFETLEKIKMLNAMANIAYVRQPYPKGDGDAVMRARSFVGNEPFLVLFGDDLIKNDKTAAMQLVDTFERKNATVIASIEVSDKEVSNYGIMETEKDDDNFIVSKFLEKPKSFETESRSAAIGKYVLTPDIFNYLDTAAKTKLSGEIRLADAFELMRQEKDIYGVKVKGERFDTGSKIGFLKATIAYGLEHDEVKDELKTYLENIK